MLMNEQIIFKKRETRIKVSIELFKSVEKTF